MLRTIRVVALGRREAVVMEGEHFQRHQQFLPAGLKPVVGQPLVHWRSGQLAERHPTRPLLRGP